MDPSDWAQSWLPEKLSHPRQAPISHATIPDPWRSLFPKDFQ